MKAVIFSAGLGTRLLDETRDKPKALVEIGGKPILQHAIEKLATQGFSELIVNVHHYSSQIINFVHHHDFGVKIIISDETDKLLNTGGALKKAAPLLEGNGPVLLYNVDVMSSLYIPELLSEHEQSGALATLVVRKRDTLRYYKFDSSRRLVGWLNKKTGEKKVVVPDKFESASEMAFSGIHVVSPEIFKMMPDEESFSITGLYLSLAKENAILGYYDNSDFWIDVGKPDELAEARKYFI
jgi:NDP-sugar pyrophosphorylase family protein